MDELGIVRLDLLIDHQVLHADQYLPEPGSAFVTKQSWTPRQPGTYTVQVRAYNPADVVGQSQQIIVQVIPAVSVTVTETPTTTPSPTNTPTIIFSLLPTTTPTPSPPPPTATPTSVQPGLNVRTGPSTRYRQIGLLEPGAKAEILGRNNIGAGRWWQIQFDQAAGGVAWVSASADYSAAFNVEQVPVVPPPPTPIPPTPTFTPTPAPVKPTIVFGADRTQIRAGECVTIYWNVTNVKEVYYRGQGVAGENQGRVECPSITEYFDLRVVNLDGTIDTNTIKIEVEGGGYRSVEIDEGESVDFDVRSLTNSCSAISRSPDPWARNFNTSSSRSVRWTAWTSSGDKIVSGHLIIWTMKIILNPLVGWLPASELMMAGWAKSVLRILTKR